MNQVPRVLSPNVVTEMIDIQVQHSRNYSKIYIEMRCLFFAKVNLCQKKTNHMVSSK